MKNIQSSNNNWNEFGVIDLILTTFRKLALEIDYMYIRYLADADGGRAGAGLALPGRVDGEDPELVVGVLHQARGGELALSHVVLVGPGPGGAADAAPLDDVARDLRPSVRRRRVPLQVDR